jgi:protection-of-telomeres protein 1
LATLREKLFLLWGDLEERKSRKSTILQQVDANSRSPMKEETPKSKPFQCCVKEYGVKKTNGRTTEDVESGNDGDSEGENASAEADVRRHSNWTWERKWRMFGCTIL